MAAEGWLVRVRAAMQKSCVVVELRGGNSQDRLHFMVGTVGGEVAGFDSSAVANHVSALCG